MDVFPRAAPLYSKRCSQGHGAVLTMPAARREALVPAAVLRRAARRETLWTVVPFPRAALSRAALTGKFLCCVIWLGIKKKKKQKSRNNHFLILSTRDCLLPKSSSCQPFGTSNRLLTTINRKKTSAWETLYKKCIENVDEIPLHQMTDGAWSSSNEMQYHSCYWSMLSPFQCLVFSMLDYCSKGPVAFSKTTVCSIIKIMYRECKRICRSGVNKFSKSLGTTSEF
jgi:hypothetical protein